MFYILGVITGLILGSIIFIVALSQQSTIQRKTAQANSLLKPKGKIIDPENEEFEEWIDNLPKE